MIKEVELRKLNGEDQYVDWESGEELFKKSDCIPIEIIKKYMKDIEKEMKSLEQGSYNYIDLLQTLECLKDLIFIYTTRKEL